MQHAQQACQEEIAAIPPLIDALDRLHDDAGLHLIPTAQRHLGDFRENVALAFGCILQCLAGALAKSAVWRL